MKKISLSILAMVFAGTSVFALDHAPVKKTKQTTCHTCSKDKCTKKANCPNKGKCACE